MTALDHDAPAVTIPLLPERPRRAGPQTRRLLRRTVLVLAAVEALATVLLIVGAPVAGTSLIIPGGGLLYTRHPILFAVTAALVVLSIVLWWAISISWGIPFVWLASGALAVILGGAIILATGAAWIDPFLSLVVAVVIVVGVAQILRDATDVLLESVPRGLDTLDLTRAVCGIDGVVAVHDLHVWTIGSGANALSAHVQIADRRVSEADALLREIDARLRADYAITHATLQLECANCGPDATAICTQSAPAGSPHLH